MDKEEKEEIGLDSNFSVLERYGTDVTKEEYITNPAIGRDSQIKDLILILLTPEKSAILIGKPGIGKTAIVEGLAYRLQNDDVPEALKGYTIINMKTASLLGTMPNGESKVQKMIDELKEKDKVILFIDEIHMLIGATDNSSLDFANIFKEGLGRGSIKVIGATTTEEYERYILRDKAFTRRFQKIEVTEPDHDETVKIMMGTLPKFEKQTGRKMKYTSFIQERIMSFIVDITSEYKRVFALGSRYPDVSLTLLKQAFSYTVYDDRPYMDIFDIRKAIENSKNIYPDVIQKELPKFDEIFKDIILEEKGEKPIEEWRKDGTPTREEIDKHAEGENTLEEVKEEKEEKKEEEKEIEVNSPEELQKMEKVRSSIISEPKRRKPRPNIPGEGNMFMEIGATEHVYGRKEKINRTGQSQGIDDIIIGSDVEALRSKKNNNNNQGRGNNNYVMNAEVRPGVNDNLLLGGPIESTLARGRAQNVPQQVGVYRNGNARRNNNQNYNQLQFDQGYGPQGNYGPPPGYGPQGNYGPPPGYGPQGNYGPPPGYGPPQGYDPNYGPPRNNQGNRNRNRNQNYDRYYNPNEAEYYDNRPRKKQNINDLDDNRDVTRDLIQMNKRNGSRSVGGMVSLSDSDDATLFGYLNKNEQSNNNNSNRMNSSVDLSGNIETNSPPPREPKREQPREIKPMNNPRGNSGPTDIRALIEDNVNQREEAEEDNIEEFPMMDIMKSLSKNNTKIDLSNIEADDKLEKPKKEEKQDKGDKKWTYLSNDDLLGGMDTINESSDSSIKSAISDSLDNMKIEEAKGDFVDLSELNSGNVKTDDLNIEPVKQEAPRDPLADLNFESVKQEVKQEPLPNIKIEPPKSEDMPDLIDLNIEPPKQDTKPEPLVDLNLETGAKEDNVFDDFFE